MTLQVIAGEQSGASASRLLIGGGIALIAAGMIFGEIFAMFVLHQNADRIGEALLKVNGAVARRNAPEVLAHFSEIGGSLENRGTKVDTHAHVIDFGYLALLLALVQPHVAFNERRKRRLAAVFLTGSVMLPVSVLAIHYVGLKYSPLQSIGWASITADLGGLLVILACGGQVAGIWKHLRAPHGSVAHNTDLPNDADWCSRVLLAGGAVLVLAGFLHGAWYAIFDLDRHETSDRAILAEMIGHSVAAQSKASADLTLANQAVSDYGMLQADKAVKIAAHSHIIEFGLMAMLLAFVQRRVLLSERWRKRWVVILLAGSVILPSFVLLETRMGLLAGGIADFGGLLVAVALIAMLVGVIRDGGARDAGGGTRE